MKKMNKKKWLLKSSGLVSGALIAAALGAGGVSLPAWATAPTVLISQVPLTVAIPAHPQVMIAIGNSQSTDGDLSGAILTGSGALSTDLSPLYNSSSPVSYTIPAGFTPPVNAGSGGSAPYTSTVGSTLVDNSASRLNVAKAGLSNIISTYLTTTDFGLVDYNTSNVGAYNTWVYFMSNPGGFTFSSTVPTSGNYVVNPCYNYKSLATSDSIEQDCAAMAGSTLFTAFNLSTSKYMILADTSDEPSINDVLYAGSEPGIFLTYNGPSPANPFPPNFTLAQFEAGSVLINYSSSYPTSVGAFGTSPTNAGYVPYAQQVMYVQRGFGYYSSQAANTGTVLVPMTTAGQVPTTATYNAAVAKFTPFFAPETNVASTSDIKASGVQSPIAGLLTGTKNYFTTSNPASSNGCNPLRYVVLVTDGLPTLDLSNNAWPPLGSQSAAGYGVTASFNADGSLKTTNDQALTDTITVLASLKAAGIKTYIIGVGAGVDPTQNPVAAATLTAMSVAGGTNAYFPATDPTSLANDLQVILSTIVGATQSISSAAVNSTGLNTGSYVYQAQFTTSDSPYQDWTGNMFAFPINATTGAVSTTPASALWQAQPLLDAQSPTARLITTWNPATSKAIPFEWTTSGTANISPTSTLGVALNTATVATNAVGANRLNYLRGDTSLEQRKGGTYRNRSHILGDIVDSTPLYVGAPSGHYVNSSYYAFEAAQKTRQPMLYVGGNDGMLHAFNATTGQEVFGFIPNGVFANIPKLTNPFYNQQHQFFVDGTPEATDIQFSDNTWHTLLIGSEAAGGSTLFGIDVTNPALFNSETSVASQILWEFSDANMGYGFSTPALASTAAGYLGFFGNGYDSSTGQPYLYAINPQTGATVAKISLCAAVASACSSTAANGLASVTLANTTGAVSAPANVLYAGDLQGNLWRVDISNSDPTQWVTTVLFQARDSSGNAQPITVAPEVTLNPSFPVKQGSMVFFGTGELLGVADLSSTQTQTIYGVYDPGLGATYKRANLVQQTLTAGTVNGVGVRVATGNAVNLNTSNGWYVDLNLQAGEREVTAPVLEGGGGLVITTYTPSTSLCTGGGAAYLLVLNFATGGYLPQPELDISGNGKLDSSSQLNGQNPVGLALGNVYAASPTVISASLGPAKRVKLITESNGVVKNVLDRGGGQQRTAWQEIH